MIKTYTLNKIEEEQISDKKGTMTFHLTDEKGDSRKVTGITFLDENKKAKGICSSTKRELPLVQLLFEMKENEVLELEFKYFNDKYNRDLDKTANQIAYEAVLEMERERNPFYRLSKLFKKLFNVETKESSTA